MKKITLLSFFLSIASFGVSQNIPNPASLYAKFLGYKSVVVADEKGNQSKVCILPDSSKCDEWAFFRGTCGQKFSYCALKGFNVESCVDSSQGFKMIICKCVDPIHSEIKFPLVDFMMMYGDTLYKEEVKPKRK